MQAEHARLESGGQNGFDQRLAGLEVFTSDRCAIAAREFQHGRNIHGKVGRSVGEGHSFTQRCVCVDHGRSNVLVILLKSTLKSLDGRMDFTLLQKDLSGAAPDHYQPLSARLLPEVSDVGAELL